jgi:hypothetical protein
MRQGMWEKVEKRSHFPQKLYTFGAGSDDVMLYGTVDYELKDGKKTSVEWSARSHFAEEDGQLKMDFYQVYLVGITLPDETVAFAVANLRPRILLLCQEPSKLILLGPWCITRCKVAIWAQRRGPNWLRWYWILFMPQVQGIVHSRM